MNNLKVLDLFCGCGGFTSGLQDAGLNVVAGIDIWDAAIKTYNHNFEHEGICQDLTKFSPRKFKIQTNIKHVDIIVGGPPCFIQGTRVVTSNGYKLIETVSSDDRLLTHTGQFQQIIDFQRTLYSGYLCSVHTAHQSSPIISTREHPYYIREKNYVWNNCLGRYIYHFKNPVWKEAINLSNNDYVGMIINTNKRFPEFQVEEQSIILNMDEHWRFLGYFVANGWITRTKETNIRVPKFAINFSSPEVCEDIRKVLHLTDQEISIKSQYIESSNLLWYTILITFGIHEKNIPEWVHDCPKHLIQQFINGYIKGHDHINATKHRITNISYNLAYGLQRLYLKLGHIYSVCKSINQHNTYDVKVILDSSSFIDGNYAWFPISKIETVYTADIIVYNFEVQHDNSYVVENVIVHNCQGFSNAGRRDPKDPRNSLFKEFVKYLDYFSPFAFIMENVVGILSMKTANNEKVINIIMNELNKRYHCAYYKLLAADFEVPQNRRRVIFIGFRKDLHIFPTKPRRILETKDHLPVKSILLNKEDVSRSYFLSPKAIAGIIRRRQQNKKKGFGFGAQYLNLDKPSYTIPARYWKDGYDALVKYSDDYIRRLTESEVSKIQTFPDNFVILGSKKNKFIQLGNAVACKFAYHLGKYLINRFNEYNGDLYNYYTKTIQIYGIERIRLKLIELYDLDDNTFIPDKEWQHIMDVMHLVYGQSIPTSLQKIDQIKQLNNLIESDKYIIANNHLCDSLLINIENNKNLVQNMLNSLI